MWALVVFALVGSGLWWRHHRAGGPAMSIVIQPQRGAGSSSPLIAHGTAVDSARLTITVIDDHGVLADATVRLAPSNGEIVVVKTGRDGVARADHLEPGAWKVSASAADHLPAALPVTQLTGDAEAILAIKLASGGRTLRGTVSDATGGPVAGARIDAARLTTGAEPADEVSSTFTAADGGYRLSVAPGMLMVRAASPEYAPQARTVEVGVAGAVADFALVPGGVIEGVVRDDHTKQPVAGASVLARRDSPAILLAESGARDATSGADGRFRIGGLRPGAWELAAHDHARFSKTPTIIGLGIAEQVIDVDLLIGAGPVIRGNIIDETGAPAANAQLRAFARGASGEANADASGAFVLEGLRPGEYVLTASGATYVPAGDTRIALIDKDVDHVVVRVQRCTSVQGHVEPRQVCEIQQALDAHPSGLTGAASSALTAADGEFTIGPAQSGITRLTARCASGDQGATQVTVARDMAHVILKVAPGASIAGRVVDADGKTVPGVGVIANEVSRGERTTIRNGVIISGAQTVTDASGAYQIDGLWPGTYQIDALERGKPMHLRSARPSVVLVADEHKTGIDLVVDRPNGVISGTVTGPDGKQFADAWVSVQQDLMSTLAAGGHPGGPGSRLMVIDNGDDDGAGGSGAVPPALTDARGHYEIHGLSDASYSVTAEARRGELRARATNIMPDATVDLRVLGVTTLSGSVTGLAGSGVLFSVELEGPTRAQRSFSDSRFSFGRVDPGVYTVRVQAGNGNGEVKVEVKPGEPATVEVALAANATVIGTLVDTAGKPLAHLPVVLMPDHNDGRPQVQLGGALPTTGPDGRFRIEHRAEACALMVMLPQRLFSKRGLMLEAGKTLDLGVVTVTTSGVGSGSPLP